MATAGLRGSIAALAILIPVASVSAGEPLVVQPRQPVVALDRFVEVHEDRDSTLRLEDVADPGFAERFRRPRSGRDLAFGASRSTYWFRFGLANPTSTPVELLLEVGYPQLDRVELFQPLPGGGFRSELLGDTLPFDRRLLKLRHLVFPLVVEEQTTSTFYLRVKTLGLASVPLHIASPPAYLERAQRHQLGLGLLYGVLLGTIFYNLFLLFSVRDVVYLHLVGHALGIGAALACLDGLLVQLWPSASAWNQWTIHVALLVISVTTVLFARRLLAPGEAWLSLDRVLRALPWLLLASAGLAALWGRAPFATVGALGLAVAGFVLTAAVFWTAMRADRATRVYLLAWVLGLLAVAVVLAASFRLIPALPETVSLIRTAATAEVLLAAVAVAAGLAQTRRALTLSEAKFANAFRSSPDGITISTLEEGRFLDVNEAFEKISGHRREEMIGHTSAELGLWPPDRRERAVEALRQQGGIRDFETEIVTRSGELVPVLLSAEEIAIQGQACIVAVLRDIRERKKAREQRERLIRELEAKNTELEAFTYTVSHDLKTPLVTIAGFAGLLEQDAAHGNLERLFDGVRHIRDASKRMRSLLDDLLELSRVGRVVHPSESVSLRALAEEARQLIVETLKERGIEVEISADLPVVVGDRVRLLQVFQNLLDNAVRGVRGQPSPKIEIGVRLEQDTLVCFVRDNGIGVEPIFHDRIFGLFERLDSETEGSGIGLALVRRIIEFHDGRIWVESEGAGRGATFCFVIP